jgi:hypothetical protein
MMATIDTRFLTVHPRTLLWWRQREQCATCAHLVETPENVRSKSGGGMQCGVVRAYSPSGLASCISARDEGQACGPDAVLWEPRA